MYILVFFLAIRDDLVLVKVPFSACCLDITLKMFRIPSSLRFIGSPSRQIFSSKGKLLISGVLELFKTVRDVLKMNVR